MDISLNILRIIIIILFGIYELGAFKNNKSLRSKLLPMILTIVIGLILLVLASFFGPIGYFFIFTILITELSLIGAILVILIEICMILFSFKKDLKRVIILTAILFLLVTVYYLGQRVF